MFALDPVMAVIINNGTAILAELNGLRPLLGTGVPAPNTLAAKDSSASLAESNNSDAALNEKSIIAPV